jgi:hypothetical protein
LPNARAAIRRSRRCDRRYWDADIHCFPRSSRAAIQRSSTHSNLALIHHVRLWHKGDIPEPPMNVRFQLTTSGHTLTWKDGDFHLSLCEIKTKFEMASRVLLPSA